MTESPLGSLEVWFVGRDEPTIWRNVTNPNMNNTGAIAYTTDGTTRTAIPLRHVLHTEWTPNKVS